MQAHIIDVNEENLNQVLQASQTQPLVLNFFAPSMPESVAFLERLKKVAQTYAGQILLATVNCEQQQMLAGRFQLQTLPTTYLFKNGQALGAFQGVVTDSELQQQLSVILPKEEELKFQQAMQCIEKGQLLESLPLLKEAWQLSDKKNPEIAFIYAETYLVLKRIESAQEVLNQVKLEDRNGRWQELQAQVELLLKASDTEEIQQLQQAYEQTPTPALALKLALALHQAGRSEEALSGLFAILQKDLNAENGEVKKEFLAILTALGNTEPLTNQYRRKLYSLLY